MHEQARESWSKRRRERERVNMCVQEREKEKERAVIGTREIENVPIHESEREIYTN